VDMRPCLFLYGSALIAFGLLTYDKCFVSIYLFIYDMI
jgi:hypothetical protein